MLAYHNHSAFDHVFLTFTKVTEFDVNEADEFDKADDLEDFMRIAFSYPEITGIILWSWIKLPGNEATWDKAIFELGDNDDFIPNEGGKRWLELVKSEWNSTTSISNTDEEYFLYH